MCGIFFCLDNNLDVKKCITSLNGTTGSFWDPKSIENNEDV